MKPLPISSALPQLPLVLATLALLGWALDIDFLKRGMSSSVAMNPTTAVCMILLALEAIRMSTRNDHVALFRAGQLIVIIVIAISTMKLGDILFGSSFAIDQQLFSSKIGAESDHPSRMAPNTAACFFVLGWAMQLMRARSEAAVFRAQLLALTAMLLALLALIGHLFDQRELSGITHYIPMAINTALAFLLLSASVLLIHPDKGLMRVFTGGESPSLKTITSFLLPGSILLPLLLGWLSHTCANMGWFDMEFALALTVIMNAVALLVLSYIGASRLFLLDAVRRKSELGAAALIHRNQVLMQSTTEGVHVLDDQGNIIEANAAFCRHLGYTQEEMLRLSVFDFEAMLDADKIRENIKALRHSHAVFETRHRRKNGTEVDVEINIAGLELDGRQCLFALSRDITERKLIDDELRSTHSSLVAAQKLAQIGSWEWDVRSNEAKWSDETYRIFGIDKNKLSEHRENFIDMILPGDRSLVDKALSDALDGSSEYDIVYRVSIADGTFKVIHALAEVVRDTAGKPLVMRGTVQDISEKRLSERRIEELSHFDQLTGLPNRTLLIDHFKFSLSLAQRGGESLAVMFLDLDHFKNINDTLGHSIGDQLLKEVATRLKTVLREVDVLSRQGGDEFILILPGADADGAAQVAAKLIEVVSLPCHVEQQELIVTPSIGISIYPYDGETLELLSKNADTAMYRAKDGGRNNFRFFTPEMQTQSARNLQLANALRYALARNELSLHYQPQLSIEDGHIVGAEALLRWQHPELGMVSPAEFIPIAEDIGQIIQIGEWVLRTAAKQLKDWLDSGMPPITMAVNLSAVQFRQLRLTELVVQILDEIELPHKYLELELTEAAMMDNPLDAIAVMNRLHEQGIHMSIDDFGTGYSSLSYLKQFKVYKLKIDQSFVRDITDDNEDKAIVTAIINMATSLGMQTIAEGVETAGQLAFLRLQGCREVQGYYFSKPLPTEQFEAFARKSQGG
ncbi:MAG: EAL domain-containing protein [Gallionellaceae bacterium]|jgi:diguanylate cyclase (GGDEF)-like protein/PAS domain S-box-containing protein